MGDNVRFVERVQEFEAQRFDYENPRPIIEWVRSKNSHGVVVFEFPRDMSEEAAETVFNEMQQFLEVRDYRPETAPVVVPQGYWLIFSWPKGERNRKWVVMEQAQFDLTFKESDD